MVSVALFCAIHATTPPQHWGEVTQALLFHQTRELLLRLDGSSRVRHVRNWRPQLLLLLSDPSSELRTSQTSVSELGSNCGSGSGCGASGGRGGSTGGDGEALASCLNLMKKSGLLLLAHVVPVAQHASMFSEAESGSSTTTVTMMTASGWPVAARACQQRQRDLLELVEDAELKAFPTATIASSVLSGLLALVSGGAGLGSLAPNIVCFGHRSGRRRTSNDSDRRRRGLPPSLCQGVSEVSEDSDGTSGDGDLSSAEYVAALQACLFFGKSVLLASGFGGIGKVRAPSAGGAANTHGKSSGGGGGVTQEWQVDVWVWGEEILGTLVLTAGDWVLTEMDLQTSMEAVAIITTTTECVSTRGPVWPGGGAPLVRFH